MKAFLILEDGHVFKGTSIGSTRDVISEIVFNTSMTGYLEVMTDPSYAGQAVCMTYPLIGNYGICYDDQESSKPWVDGFIVRELSRVPSNFRSVDTIQHFLTKHDIPGIAGIDTRALTKILREKGTMNGMITVNENYDLVKRIKETEKKNATLEKKVSVFAAALIRSEIIIDSLQQSNVNVSEKDSSVTFTSKNPKELKYTLLVKKQKFQKWKKKKN